MHRRVCFFPVQINNGFLVRFVILPPERMAENDGVIRSSVVPVNYQFLRFIIPVPRKFAERKPVTAVRPLIGIQASENSKNSPRLTIGDKYGILFECPSRPNGLYPIIGNGLRCFRIQQIISVLIRDSYMNHERSDITSGSGPSDSSPEQPVKDSSPYARNKTPRNFFISFSLNHLTTKITQKTENSKKKYYFYTTEKHQEKSHENHPCNPYIDCNYQYLLFGRLPKRRYTTCLIKRKDYLHVPAMVYQSD